MWTYLLLGAGRQGIAAAYDLGRFGDARRIVVADIDAAAADRGAARLNALLGREAAVSLALDVADEPAVARALRGVQGCLNSVHYAYNERLTSLLIEAGVHATDLGGHTGSGRRAAARRPRSFPNPDHPPGGHAAAPRGLPRRHPAAGRGAHHQPRPARARRRGAGQPADRGLHLVRRRQLYVIFAARDAQPGQVRATLTKRENFTRLATRDTRAGLAPGKVIVDNHILRTRAAYQFTRALSLRAIVDYGAVLPDSALIDLQRDKSFTADVLVSWQLNPWTALYVGYTDGYANLDIDPVDRTRVRRTESPFHSIGRQVFVKFSYLLRF